MSYEDEKWPSAWLRLLGFIILAPFICIIGFLSKRKKC